MLPVGIRFEEQSGIKNLKVRTKEELRTAESFKIGGGSDFQVAML